MAQGLTKEGDAMAGHAINQQSFSGVPWRVWEPTPAVQFPAQPEASASKKSAVWAWNPNLPHCGSWEASFKEGCAAYAV